MARRYDEEFGRKYLSDYVDVHVALGLGLKVGTASVVSPLGNVQSVFIRIVSLGQLFIEAY